jgi:hypothetical protein
MPIFEDVFVSNLDTAYLDKINSGQNLGDCWNGTLGAWTSSASRITGLKLRI